MTTSELLGAEVVAAIDSCRAPVRFAKGEYLWWVPASRGAISQSDRAADTPGALPSSEGAPQKIELTDFDRLIVDISHAMVALRKAKRVVVVYPTTRQAVLVPLVISLAYETGKPGGGVNCVYGWTPRREMADSYHNVWIGHLSPEAPINTLIPRGKTPPSSLTDYAPTPSGMPHPKRPVRVLLGSRIEFFDRPIPDGFRPIALVLDANHRLVPQRFDQIEKWADANSVDSRIILVSNPFHAFLNELRKRGYLILAWSATEAALVNRGAVGGRSQLDNPFRRSRRPLENLTRPDFQYQVTLINDAEVNALLVRAYSLLLQFPGSANIDPIGRQAGASAAALLRKMAGLSTPLDLNVKHAAANPVSASIPRHAESLRAYAERIRAASPANADRLIQFASIVEEYIAMVHRAPPGKAKGLATMVGEISRPTCIAVPTFYEIDALEEFLQLKDDSQLPRIIRIADMDDAEFADELWLPSLPSFFQLHYLRSGIAPLVRLLIYPMEQEFVADLVEVAHAAGEGGESRVERVQALSAIYGRKFQLSSGPASASRPPPIMTGGTVISRKRSSNAPLIIREIQKSLDWSQDGTSDPPLAAPGPPGEGTRPGRQVDVVKVNLDDGRGIVLEPDDLVSVVESHDEDPEPRLARDLTVGEEILISTSDYRKSVNATLLERLNKIPRIGAMAYLASRWSSRLKAFRARRDLTYPDLYDLFRRIEVNGKRTTIRTPMTLRFWAEGTVLGPRNPEDLERALVLAETPDNREGIKRTLAAIRRLRGLRVRLMKHILRQARDGLWDEAIVIDEEFDVYFDDFQGLFRRARIVAIRGDRLSADRVGGVYTWET